MSLKGFMLASGREECSGWTIRCIVKEDGLFKTKGIILVRSNEEARKFCKKQYEDHGEERREYMREYNKEHKEEKKEWKKGYAKTSKGEKVIKKAIAKVQAKRRDLGFESLNEPFEGSEGHHMTKDLVVFIPKELHRSVDHNIWTGKGMEEINGKVLIWAGRNLEPKRPIGKR